MPPQRIDAHHHLWRYSAPEYPWMLAGMESIRRDFLIPELKAAMLEGAINGVITVQARQSLTETEWLLDLAAYHPFMLGVVGWVPLTDPRVASHLERYVAQSKLKAVRHVLHDESDDNYMLRDDFNRGIALLHDFGLAYDILIFERHLPQTITFVDRHPNQVFVVDHIAKPRIKEGFFSPWKERMADLAKRPNVYCKLSGLVTEAAWTIWTEPQLRPYIEIVLECFTPFRVMFGSDWPVQLVASSYGQWIQVVERAITALSAAERQAIFAHSARTAYRL
jgi:L-fucono-1,5-lactonase